MPQRWTIWCNTAFSPEALELLKRGLAPHRLLLSPRQTGNLDVSGGDPLLEQADIAFGQPKPEQLIALPRIKWVHLTTAGYTRYDRDDLRKALQARGTIMSNSSTVFAEPCAQHTVAFMFALARKLPAAIDNQRGPRAWPSAKLRNESRLLNGQTALIVGFGAIGRRIAEMLGPFKMKLIAVRRKPRGDEPIRCVPDSQIDELLPETDHVINVLPESKDTEMFFHADRLARCKASACFYNIGRGSTVDQYCLWTMLETRKLAAAYLDVTSPEPPPCDNPLWTCPHCYITPHTAGGHDKEFESNVSHFLENFRRFQSGQPLLDRII